MTVRRASVRSRAVAVPLTVLLAGAGMSACTNDTAGDEEPVGDVAAVEEPLDPLEDDPVDEPVEDEGLVAEPLEDDAAARRR